MTRKLLGPESEPEGGTGANPTLREDDRVGAWFAEAHRLFLEAEERFVQGDLLPALSSLAAVPPLHRRLTERCSEILACEVAENSTADIDRPCGLYL